MSEKDSPLIGVDVGGTNFRVGVVRNAQVVWEQRFQADFAAFCRNNPPQAALQFILDTLADGIQEARSYFPAVRAAGVGFPGFVDPVTQCVSQSPNLPGLLDVNLSVPLSNRLQLPILVENDALAAAYGELACSGPEEGKGSLMYIGLGTGVGGGLILDGRAYPGVHGVAMEVGHLIIEENGRQCGCGNRGCLEQYASASGVVTTYAELSGIPGQDAAGISKLARQGDAHALAAYVRAGEVLGQGLASILKIVDVSPVIIGGGLGSSWDLMAAAFHARLEADLIPALRNRISIQLSHAGDQAGIIGAAMLSRS